MDFAVGYEGGCFEKLLMRCLELLAYVLSRMLESLAGCLTELCAPDFYWIFFSFRLFIFSYSSFFIDFPRFYKRYFRPIKILLQIYSQNNYQIWLHKLNLMYEELFYQIINISAAKKFLQGLYMKYICNVIFPTVAFFTAFLFCMYFMYNPTYFVFGSRLVRTYTLWKEIYVM